ncbi:MAG TPA: DUF2085 domain-containing protein, partial [Thermoplasmatales archaeon]|nr:DUF2085 domain-containing protein [Thermoplasmatales archaeon]
SFRKDKRIILLLFLAITTFFVLQLAAPFFLPQGNVIDLSGQVGVVDNEQQIKHMTSPWNIIYEIGDLMCHQKSERSFFINGNQMPFCSRCTAIWLGLATGLGIIVFVRIRLDGKFIVCLLLGLVPIGIDGIGQLLGFWESINTVRFISGLLAGFVCGIATGVIVQESCAIKK